MPVRLTVAMGKCEEHGTPGGVVSFVEYTRARSLTNLALAAIDAFEAAGGECDVEVRVLLKSVGIDDLTPKERDQLVAQMDARD